MTDLLSMVPGGELNQEVISVTVVNDTRKIIDVTVPAGKKWILLSIKTTNPDDVARIVRYKKYLEAGKTNLLSTFSALSVNSGIETNWPTRGASTTTRAPAQAPAEMLNPGNTLETTWEPGGVSAGGTNADGLVIEYLEFPAP